MYVYACVREITKTKARIDMGDEKQVERYLCRRVRRIGGRAYKWTSPGCRGVPDRLVFFPGGGIVPVELKAPKKSEIANQV